MLSKKTFAYAKTIAGNRRLAIKFLKAANGPQRASVTGVKVMQSMDVESFLILALDAYRRAHHLPEGGDAEELASWDGLTEAQREWLDKYCALWECLKTNC